MACSARRILWARLEGSVKLLLDDRCMFDEKLRSAPEYRPQ